MIPHVAPPVWPSLLRPGRFAATIVHNAPELGEDEGAREQVRKCRVALLGIPDDTGVEMNGGRIGAKGGPAAFRSALARYGVASPADEGEGPGYPRVFDAGDVVIGADIHETHDRITEATLAILEMGLLPIAVGGGHDCTFGFVRGVARAFGTLGGMYLDAHLDVRAEVGSGMPFRALLEGGFVKNPVCVGMNPLVNTREHAEYFQGKGGRFIAADAGARSAGEWRDPAFVSLDLDGLDGAIAPGVSAPNPCGASAREVEAMVREAGRAGAVRCFDIMELNPGFDADGRTARLAAHMFLTFLRGLAERGGSVAGAGS